MNKRILIPIFIVLALLIAAGWWYYATYLTDDDQGILSASGTVEAVEISISPELSGRVAVVYVQEGEVVQEGDPLFELESDLLAAQRERAQAALEAAQAGYEVALQSRETAQAAYDAALVQYQIAVTAARAADIPARRAAWQTPVPDAFDTPPWYFVKSEEMQAAESEVAAAAEALEAERANFERVAADASNADLLAAEQRLAEAQTAYQIAQDILDRANAQKDEHLKNYAQDVFDTAEAELESAQLAYDQILSDQATEDVLEARARLAVAQERYDTAVDHRDSLLTGDESLQVQAAEAALKQAEAQLKQVETNITQAEAMIAQAEAELNLLNVQMEKLVVRAPVGAVVMSRKVEPGEIVQPGSSLMTLGELDSLSITVYIPEDRYGQVSLGDYATVSVDSFPGETFNAEVIRIADKAEFTPRNVQTPEGRRTTVFAVKLAVENAAGKLKPGMPADVVFESVHSSR
jgi:HlyD family secretion protein